jgi:translation initiation factor IF-2
MFRKIVDVLKEVFWMKPSRKARKPARRKAVLKSPVKKSPAKKSPVKKKIVKTLKKPLAKAKALTAPDPSLMQVGVITHYFDRIKVCVVQLTQGTVLIGDKLTILGDKTKFVQKIWSMQIESKDVKVARKGQLIGIKVDKMVAVGDKAYK